MKASSIDPVALADLIEAVAAKRRIELDARDRLERAYQRRELATQSRAAAEQRLTDYMADLVQGACDA